jgi:hypothetical protein
LQKESHPISVLLGCDAEDLEFALFNKVLGFAVPPGHMLSAACSPRGKDVNEGFFTAKGFGRNQQVIFCCREGESREIGSRGECISRERSEGESENKE